MKDEFDPAKDAANRAKHGLSLADAAAIFADPDVVIADTIREEDGEARVKAIGLIEGRLHTVIFVWRGKSRRFISFRRSNQNEQRLYDSDPR